MSVKTPSFWYREQITKPSFRERVFTPLSWLYACGRFFHQRFIRPYKSRIPVICIGNLNAGGTGKTPTVLSIRQLVTETGFAQKPFFLIRGYGGAEPGPLLVKPEKHTSWDVGDEALLLAKHGPTIVGGDRAASARLAEEKGADLLIMDDGLQNPTLFQDIKIAVINGEMGFGNKKMMPAGPLRESLRHGLNRVDAFILIGEDRKNIHALLPEDKPAFKTSLHTNKTLDPKQPFLAFAGLGYPQKFFTFLQEKLGLNIVESIAFSDHYPYSAEDFQTLCDQAKKLGATLLTTEKDYMRLPVEEGKPCEIETLPIELQWQDRDALLRFLKNRLPPQDS